MGGCRGGGAAGQQSAGGGSEAAPAVGWRGGWATRQLGWAVGFLLCNGCLLPVSLLSAKNPFIFPDLLEPGRRRGDSPLPGAVAVTLLCWQDN